MSEALKPKVAPAEVPPVSFPSSLVKADIYHGRRGRTRNAFRYRADLLLLNVTRGAGPIPMVARNRAGAMSLHDRDYGDGRSSLDAYAARRKRELGLEAVCDGEVMLLTQARRLGFIFNPVSFWFFLDRQGRIRAMLAEVANFNGDRHTYLCAHQDLRPILPEDEIRLRKVFHVSPFQPVDGAYGIRATLEAGRVHVTVRYDSETDDGLMATLGGEVRPTTRGAMLAAFALRPLGPMRVVALILWQAVKLGLKGASWRHRPAPPAQEVTR